MTHQQQRLVGARNTLRELALDIQAVGILGRLRVHADGLVALVLPQHLERLTLRLVLGERIDERALGDGVAVAVFVAESRSVTLEGAAVVGLDAELEGTIQLNEARHGHFSCLEG